MARVLARLSPSSVMGATIKSLVEANGSGPVQLFRVKGTAVREIRGDTALGEWVGLQGSFEVERPDGERFSGSRLFLPKGGLHDYVAMQLYGTDDMTEPRPVAIDVIVFARKANNPIGYEYYIETV